MFQGERANVAKVHALRVAHAFHQRLHNFPSPADGVSAPVPLTITQHDPSG